MFRFRSLILVSFAAIAPCVLISFEAVSAQMPAGKSSHAAARVEGGHTRTGIDVLVQRKFAQLRGKRVGLITNQTGVDSEGRRTIDLLAHAEAVELVVLFSPEHGLAGGADAAVANQSDSATRLPVYSLYGATMRPTSDMLKGLDALVFDIQDAGVRFYTYITTMAYCMEAAARQHVAFFVLDRPNPLGGEVIEGPVLDRDRLSFVGYFPMPVRYAMTMGELARMFNAENKIGADLHVISMENWHRSDTFDMTGLTWIAPSPALRTVRSDFLYPGVEILQAAGVSVGRGTSTPFEMFGAPWINSSTLLAELNRRTIPGVKFAVTQFTPASGIYTGQLCAGVSLGLTDRDSFRTMLMGLEIASALHRLYPEQFHAEKMIELLGSQFTVNALAHGDDPKQIVASWTVDLDKFRATREKYLLYH